MILVKLFGSNGCQIAIFFYFASPLLVNPPSQVWHFLVQKQKSSTMQLTNNSIFGNRVKTISSLPVPADHANFLSWPKGIWSRVRLERLKRDGALISKMFLSRNSKIIFVFRRKMVHRIICGQYGRGVCEENIKVECIHWGVEKLLGSLKS